MASKIKLFRGDVLVTKKNINDVSESSIILKLDDEHKESVNFFEVLDTGPEVKEVRVGDTVLIKFLEHTPAFNWDGRLVAITDESVIEGVVEHD